MFWSSTVGTPVVETQGGLSALPTELQMGPSELAVLTVTLPNSDAVTTLDEQTYYSERVLEPMAVTKSQASPYTFNIRNSGEAAATAQMVSMRVRVGFGGPAASNTDAIAAFHRAAAGLSIEVDGVSCVVDYTRQTSGRLHVDSKDFTYFTSIEVPVPIDQLALVTGSSILVWSEAAHETIVSTVVLVVDIDTTFALVGNNSRRAV